MVKIEPSSIIGLTISRGGGGGGGGDSNSFLFVCGNIAAEKGELLTKVGS
jgi:hypothetical protein